MLHLIPTKTLYYGTFVNTVSISQIEICTDAAIGVDENGKIAFFERGFRSAEEVLTRHPDWAGTGKVVKTPEMGFFFPGLIGRCPIRFSELSSN